MLAGNITASGLMSHHQRAQDSGRTATTRAWPFRVTRRFACSLGLLAILGSADTRASEWPTRTVTVVVPYAAGGFTDILARIAAKHLSEKLGQPFVVENRLGAG